MSGFSGAVKIASDLNDFIAPSQSCVVSLNGNKLNETDQIETVCVQHALIMCVQWRNEKCRERAFVVLRGAQ